MTRFKLFWKCKHDLLISDFVWQAACCLESWLKWYYVYLKSLSSWPTVSWANSSHKIRNPCRDPLLRCLDVFCDVYFLMTHMRIDGEAFFISFVYFEHVFLYLSVVLRIKKQIVCIFSPGVLCLRSGRRLQPGLLHDFGSQQPAQLVEVPALPSSSSFSSSISS